MSAEALKVTASHLARNAYLYIRQSTLKQVLHNTESAIRQYDLRGKAIALGWDASQITVIDIDQGQSGASTADREGFQQMVAEVSLGRAGIVLGLECSRLARNNADWHQLLELCAMTGTLICDEDGLYDPRNFNDRLVLGMKGQISEYELHFIRARLRGGQLSAARRGELRMGLPVGLAYDVAGHVVPDPDAGVQQALRHLFAVFARTGSARAVVTAFAAEKLPFPVRISTGPRKGELAWMPLTHWRVLRTLHNPRYAGAFVYGRRRGITSANGKNSLQPLPRDQWTALIPGAAADAAAGQLLLEALTPLTLEVALTVQAEIEARAAEADAMRASHVERARHRADLARRRYLAAGPGNRLVAGTLEADWNQALRALQAAQDDYDHATAATTALTGDDKTRIRALAADFPALWTNPATPQRERKRMARLLIDDVTMTKTDRIHLDVRFRGGQTTSLDVPIPPPAWQLRQTKPEALALLDRLLDDHTDGETAAALNAAGHRSGEGKPFTSRIVLDLRQSHHLPSHADRLRARGLLTMTETAARLGVHISTIKAWRRAGLLIARKANDRNVPLFDPPDPADPRLVKRQGSKLTSRVHTAKTPGGAV